MLKKDTPKEKSSSPWTRTTTPNKVTINDNLNNKLTVRSLQQNLKKKNTHDTNENKYHLTQTHRANRRRPLPARRHLRRLCRRLCGTQDVRRRQRGGHGWERCRELRIGAYWRRRRP